MREWYPPYTSTPPPPSLPPKTSMPMLHYGLVVIGVLVFVLAVYNLIIIKWCATQRQRLHDTTTLPLEVASLSMRSSVDCSANINKLGISFKYKKGDDSLQVEYDNQECPVCLSVFEEEEEVRQLPICKHSFHAPCIDRWLSSHLDCPLCRTQVELPDSSQKPSTSENSREVLILTSENSREVPQDPAILV